MRWKNIRNKRKWEFNSEYKKEGTQKLINPARGWYEIYTFHIKEKIDPEQLKWSLRDTQSIALVRLSLSGYQNRELDENAKCHLKEILDFFRMHDKDVIFRPVYDMEGKGLEAEPNHFHIVLMHLRQIGKILADMESSVFLFQGMLVGSWGEMHDSSYLTKKHLQEMKQVLMPYLKKRKICLAVRTPSQWRNLITEKKFMERQYENICIFDDAIFGSFNHMGTFGTMTREAAGWESPWNSKEEFVFLKKLHTVLPCGGEVIFPIDKEELSTKEMLKQMKQMCLTYLNAAYDQKILNQWKKIGLKQKDCGWNNFYDYIGEHMGYRFVVEHIEILKIKRTKIILTGIIQNKGFASLMQETELIISVENTKEKKERKINIDLRKIRSGEKGIFTIEVEAEEGKIFLKMQRKRDQRIIFFANEDAADQLYLGDLRQKK